MSTQSPRKSHRLRPFFWFLLGPLLGLAVLVGWYYQRLPKVAVLPTPAQQQWPTEALFRLIAPEYPDEPIWLETRLGPIKAETGRIDHVAVLRDSRAGGELWGVGYTWLGPESPEGGRTTLPGFAIVTPPTAASPGYLRYVAPGTGGWERGQQHTFENTVETTLHVEAVQLGRHQVGFLVQQTTETALGGRMGRGLVRAFLPGLTGWEMVWEEDTLSRIRPDRTYEIAKDARCQVQAPDSRGQRGIGLTPNWYIRQLSQADRGVHFLAELAGNLSYRYGSGQFLLTSFLDHEGRTHPIRSASPIYAIRAPRSPLIDGKFDDWDAAELSHVGTIWLEDMDLLRYRRRARRGTHDFSGASRLMWDTDGLYVRADVMDDKFRPAEPGPRLYEGDHLALWIDRDLSSDFSQGIRNMDDWQIGLAPGPEGTGHAWAWVPEAGSHQIQVAANPLRDPFDGMVRGYQLEAAIPWEALGGRPALRLAPAPPSEDPRAQLQPRRYSLRLAGLMGLTIVLTDSDDRPQEMAFVSAPRFTWGDPRSFNTLLLLDWAPVP